MKKSLILIIFIFGMFLALAKNVEAADYYVRAGATGSNTGTDWNNAWTDLPTSFVRGDIYYVADGAYGSHTFDTPVDEDKYITIKKATIQEHGTNTGWNDEYGDQQAFFTRASGAAITFNTGYWYFDGGSGTGLTESSYGFLIDIPAVNSAYGIYFYNGSASINNITIKHTHLKRNGVITESSPTMGWRSIYSNPSISNSNILISNNLFTDGVVHILMHNTDDSIIEHNYFNRIWNNVNNHGESIDIFEDGENTDRLTIRYNVFKDVGGHADIAMSGDGHEVYGNLFYNTDELPFAGGTGNGVIGTTSSRNTTNLKFYNNTIANKTVGSTGLVLGPGSSGVVYNNIWYNCRSPLLTNVTTHDYNLTGLIIGTNDVIPEANDQVITSDPFTNSAGGDFTLAAPTHAGKSDIGTPYNIDIIGKTRGADGTWDRGAYEFTSGQITCITGDIDCDKDIDITDIQIAVNVFLGIETDEVKRTRANVDTSNPDITIADIQKVVNLFLRISN